MITFNRILKIRNYDTIPIPSGPQNTNSHQKYSEQIPKEQDSIGKQIVDAACTVDKNPGPGLLEKVYDIRFFMKIIMF